MYYITVKQSNTYKPHQMTIEELIFETYKETRRAFKEADTITFEREKISAKYLYGISVPYLISQLTKFNAKYEALKAEDRHKHYTTFYRPKKSVGPDGRRKMRQIDAPDDELKEALYELKEIFENDFHSLYHTSAFAYIKHRSTLDCVKRHQANESRWFAKLDLHGFFPSTTLDWIMKMFSMVFPFCLVTQYKEGEEALRGALELAMLNGGLPQGTPISPLITNIMMIPIDFVLSNTLRNYQPNGSDKYQSFVYTRYADDFIISSRYDFDINDVQNLIVRTLKSFDAPFELNKSKTRYGSSSGSNWNLGVMLNSENKITVGRDKKKNFQCMLVNYARDRANGISWDLEDLQRAMGLYSYYRMVEKQTIDHVVEYVSRKIAKGAGRAYGSNDNIIAMLRDDIREAGKTM